ncbi:MAG: T9SS type A sorting domain-containing protein [Saprospiraceae bacterium]|nr:T9SS type A sorting domain-containing protein [Saprospiraceae bacterium]
MATAGTPGRAAFGAEGEIYRFGQFIVARDTAVFTSIPSLEYLPAAFIVYPNPGTAGGNLFIRTESEEAYVFTLYDSHGKQVWKGSLRGSSAVALPGLAAGVYGYSIETPTRMYRGKWVNERH